MFGFPGAGKTTTAEIISKLTGAVHLASDKVRLELFPKPRFTPEEHRLLYETIDRRVEQLLKNGKSVIYDANLNRFMHRKEKYEICERTGAVPKLIWVQASRGIAKDRAMHDSRSHLWPDGENADRMFDRVADIIEEPGASELYIGLDGTKITDTYVKTALGI